jgi:iron-sulfur cluster repair protein YtfE (RIC family)
MNRWWQEHSELDSLVEVVVEALGGDAIDSASESLEDLASALEAHFELEETAYFPLVERLSPDQRSAVEAARLGHGNIRERLQILRTLVEAGDLHAAQAALDVLLERFRTHEAEEGKLIARLEALATS